MKNTDMKEAIETTINAALTDLVAANSFLISDRLAKDSKAELYIHLHVSEAHKIIVTAKLGWRAEAVDETTAVWTPNKA